MPRYKVMLTLRTPYGNIRFTGIRSSFTCGFNFLLSLLNAMLIIQPINESLSQLIGIPESPRFAPTNDIKTNKRK